MKIKSIFSKITAPYIIKKEENPGDRAKSIILLIAIIVLLALSKFLSAPGNNHSYVTLTIDGKQHVLEYVHRKAEMKRGLKYRPHIHPEGGMLFDMRNPNIVNVSTFGMNFPVSVITLNKHLEVLEVVTLEPGLHHAFSIPARYFVQVSPTEVKPGNYLLEFHPDSNISLNLIRLGTLVSF